MLTRANPLGWVLGDKLEPGQINQIDEQIARAIDGVDGGAYSLAQPLTLDGFVTVGGTFTLNGNVTGEWATFDGGIRITGSGLRVLGAPMLVTSGSSLQVTAGSTLFVLNSDLVVGLDAEAKLTNGATFTAQAGTSVRVAANATLVVEDAAEIQVEQGGKLALAYGSSIEGFTALVDVGTMIAREELRIRGPLRKDTADSHVLDRVASLSATTQTLATLSADTYVIATAGMAGDITITVPDGEHEGQVVRFVQGRKLTAHKVNFSLSTPSTFQSAGNAFNIELTWNGVSWIPTSWSDLFWL